MLCAYVWAGCGLIVRGVYEDKSNVCLAMDVCNGGELFDAIVKKGSYSEVDAASMIRIIVGVVAHCHNMGVIHRDLKVGQFWSHRQL